MIRILLAFCILSITTQAYAAQFNYKGKGSVHYPTGFTQTFEFGFTLQQDDEGYLFTIGEQQIRINEVPTKYSIWITLNPKNKVFINEFAKGYFDSFNWKIGNYHISLNKDQSNQPTLTINKKTYYFINQTAQINVHFTEHGIRQIDTQGFTSEHEKSD